MTPIWIDLRSQTGMHAGKRYHVAGTDYVINERLLFPSEEGREK